jgi:hypothetical protein
MDRSRIVRETSRRTYRALIESGALDGMRGDVWAWLFRHGPATRNEVAIGIDGVPNDTSTRLKELVDMGNAREVGEDNCHVTGRNVILYDVTKQSHVGERPKSRPRPFILKPKNCGECPLVVDNDGEEACWMDLAVKPNYDRRPIGCDLDRRDFIIRGG